jgi:magnesium transporter
MLDTLHQPVTTIARRSVTCLDGRQTVAEALSSLRRSDIADRIVYFYVLDEDKRLIGVLPLRRLLSAPEETPVAALMVRRPVTIPEQATILEAHEAFADHRFLALPVVDDRQHVVGVVDVSMFSEEDFLPDQPAQAAALFETLGFRISQVRGASPLRAFRFRFPWLMATIASGLACAVLVSVFRLTLASSIALAFFLTLVLALGESVSIQSMTVSIQALQLAPPTWRWYRASLRRELTTALLLGVSCAALVALVLVLWLGMGPAALIVAATIVLTVAAACFYGLTIPALFHALRIDPKIASGPLTLAMADVTSIALYFGLASRLL